MDSWASTRRIQKSPGTYYPTNSWAFTTDYPPGPTTTVDPSAATDVVDFQPYGAYSIYNWETFFHAPLMIACKLMADQRHEEAAGEITAGVGRHEAEARLGRAAHEPAAGPPHHVVGTNRYHEASLRRARRASSRSSNGSRCRPMI